MAPVSMSAEVHSRLRDEQVIWLRTVGRDRVPRSSAFSAAIPHRPHEPTGMIGARPTPLDSQEADT
jgi:hypothetical protein